MENLGPPQDVIHGLNVQSYSLKGCTCLCMSTRPEVFLDVLRVNVQHSLTVTDDNNSPVR